MTGTDRVRAPTQTDVARLAGVSLATVSHVISGRSNRRTPASPEVIRRVQQAAEQLNYHPQRAGRVLQSNRTRLVAIVMYAPLNPWESGVVSQVTEIADAHRLGVVQIQYGPDVRSVDRAEEMLRDGIADAAIVLASADMTRSHLERISQLRIPTLTFGLDQPIGRMDALSQGELPAMRSATDHLIQQGRQRVAFLPSSPTHQRGLLVQGYRQSMEAHGREPLIVDVPFAAGYPDELIVSRAVRQLLNEPPDQWPDALLVASDRGAISAMWAIVERGLSIPDQIAVIGAGNIDDCVVVYPPLTTIGCEAVDYHEAIEGLISRIDDSESAPRRIEIPWQLILRGTA